MSIPFLHIFHGTIILVRKERLELSRCEALVPKTSVSTNSTTLAYLAGKAGLEPATR